MLGSVSRSHAAYFGSQKLTNELFMTRYGLFDTDEVCTQNVQSNLLISSPNHGHKLAVGPQGPNSQQKL